jgi:hypothetical protein
MIQLLHRRYNEWLKQHYHDIVKPAHERKRESLKRSTAKDDDGENQTS